MEVGARLHLHSYPVGHIDRKEQEKGLIEPNRRMNGGMNKDNRTLR